MAEIRYAVTVDSSGAVTSIKKLDEALDGAEEGMKGAGGAADEASGKAKGLWQQFAIGQLAVEGARKALSGLVNVAKSFLEAATVTENYQVRLETLLGSQEAATAAMDFFRVTAAKVPFTLEDVIDAGTKVTAFGMGFEKWTPIVADLASVMGLSLPEAAGALGRAFAGGAGAADIFRERGILNIIKDSARLKRGIDDITTLSLPEFRDVMFETFTDPEGKVSGGAQKLAATWDGTVSMIQDKWFQFRQRVMDKGVFEHLKDRLKDFDEDFQTFMDSDAGEVWAERLSVSLNGVIDALQWTGKAVGWVTDKLVNATQALAGGGESTRKWIAEEVNANKIIQQGVNVMQLKRKAIDEGAISTKEWAGIWKKYGNDWSAVMKAIAEGKEGEQIQGIFEGMKKSADEAAAAAEEAGKKHKGGIDAAAEAQERARAEAQKLKEELKLTFADDIRAEIAKTEKAIDVFADKLTPKQLDELRAKLVDLKLQLPQAFKEIDVTAGDAMQATTGLLEAVYGVTYAGFLGKKSLEEMAKGCEGVAVKAEKAEKGLDVLTRAEIRKRITDTRKTLLEMGDAIPTDEVQRLRKEIADLQAQLALPDWLGTWRENLEQFSSYADAAIGGLNSIISQAQKNKEIEIENEYKRRLDAINKNIADEGERQKAIQALEAEFEIRRTSAKRAAARQQKAVALMGAIVNTAEGVTEALPNLVLAAIVGALGAAQIALIARQPIPLAKGAVFERATLFTTASGRTYEAGEAGREILGSEKIIREILRDELRKAKPARPMGPLAVALYLDKRKVAEALIPDLASLSGRGRLTQDIQTIVRSEQ